MSNPLTELIDSEGESLCGEVREALTPAVKKHNELHNNADGRKPGFMRISNQVDPVALWYDHEGVEYRMKVRFPASSPWDSITVSYRKGKSNAEIPGETIVLARRSAEQLAEDLLSGLVAFAESGGHR